MWLFFAVGAAFPAAAPAADIRAFVDRSRIGPGESLHLTVAVSGGEGEVDTSAIKDFKILSRGTSSSIQIVNGRTSRQVQTRFVLLPLKEGTLTIPPLQVTVDGRVQETREISITVAKDTSGRKSQRNLLVQGGVSNSTPYEGEQILYRFKLLSAVKIANARFQEPQFEGFAAKQIEETKTYQTVFEGRNFAVTELAYILVPLAAGSAVIDPAILSCDIVKRRKPSRNSFDSFFDDSFFGGVAREPVVLQTEPIAVTVQKLPENPFETRFSGLVGQFQVEADIDNRNLKTGDSTTLTVSITGSGNLMDAERPEMEIPDAFKVYEDAPEAEITPGDNGYSGHKTFRTALVAVTPGRFELPPGKLVYFDPQAEKYRRIATGAFGLTVGSADEPADLNVAMPAAGKTEARGNKQAVEFTGRDILALKEDLDALTSQKPLPLIWFALYLVLPAASYLAVRTGARLLRKEMTARRKMMLRAEKALKNARKKEVSGEAFLAFLHRALVAAIFAVNGSTGESLTYLEAEKIMAEKGLSADVVGRTVALLKKIDSAKYGGRVLDQPLKAGLLAETRQLIKRSLA